MKNLKDSQLDEVKKDDTNGLSFSGMSILQVHGFIQQEKVIMPIYPSSKYNLINVTSSKRLHVPSNHILSTQVDGGTMEFLKI
jgi:hypothetical protein